MLYEQYFKDAFPFAVIPLLSYHVGQLLLDTVIARRLRGPASSGKEDDSARME
jgi:hypothetical protein